MSTTFPFDDQFPLTNYPYSSRSWGSNVDSTTKKNYNFVGFKPKSRLQASELNELQEIFAMQNTLNLNMIREWFNELNGTTCDGPAWNGATPLFPKAHPSGGTFEALVGYTYTGTGGITLTFNEGWYLITLDSGIKQWIYLNSEKNTNIVPTSTIQYYSGISFSSEYIDCTEDTSLLDNSSGSPSQSICGADRYQINFTTAGITGVTGFNEGTFQKIVKFTLTGSTLSVSYINGLTI